MHGPDGRDYQNRITYLEVVEPERLVYKHGGDEDLEPVSFQTTVTFVPQGSKTMVTMRAVFPTAEERNRVRNMERKAASRRSRASTSTFQARPEAAQPRAPS